MPDTTLIFWPGSKFPSIDNKKVYVVDYTNFFCLSSIAIDALTQVFPTLNQKQNIGSQKH